MDREVSRENFLQQLKRNVCAQKEALSLGNLRSGLSEWSEEQLALIQHHREEARVAQFTAQLRADLQRSQAEYSDVFRANLSAMGACVARCETTGLTTQPRSDVDARRHVTAPLLGLFHIFMRRQRIASRLACINMRDRQQRKLERAAVSAATESDELCAISGHGPYIMLPPSDGLSDRVAPAVGLDSAPDTVPETTNHHFVSLRPPQPLRKPLVFQQAHYCLEPFPEFCVDLRDESKRELDVYRTHHCAAPDVPALQHFSQPLVTMETFAPTSTCHLGPTRVYGMNEYRSHHIIKAIADETGDTARMQSSVCADADLYIASSAVTVDTNLGSVPEKLARPCAEDSMSEDDEDCVAHQCSFKMSPAWLPTPSERVCGTVADSSAGQLAPPPTFTSFLDRFA